MDSHREMIRIEERGGKNTLAYVFFSIAVHKNVVDLVCGVAARVKPGARESIPCVRRTRVHVGGRDRCAQGQTGAGNARVSVRSTDPVVVACSPRPDGRIEVTQNYANLAWFAAIDGVPEFVVSRSTCRCRVPRVWRVVDHDVQRLLMKKESA
jgi:hypothetical protein